MEFFANLDFIQWLNLVTAIFAFFWWVANPKSWLMGVMMVANIACVFWRM